MKSSTDKPSYPVLKSKDLSQIGQLSDLPPPSENDKYDATIDYPISKFKKIRVWVFFGTYTIIICLILFFFFFFLFANTVDQQRMYAVLNLVSHTMKSPAMADLYVTKKDCPMDYNLLSLGQWPGIEHGCYYKNDKTVAVGNCNQEDKGIGVQAIPPQTITTWEGYKFCARRYRSLAIEYSGACPYGFKKCGTTLCIPEEDKCPITLVYWVEGAPPQNSTQEIILIDYENNRYMIVERSETRQPLVGFGLSYNGVPCLDNISSPFPEKIYPLLNYKSNCNYGQNFEAAIIASRPEQGFVDEISIAEPDIKKLPLMETYSANNTVYFVGQNRFKVRPDNACSSPEHFFVMGKVTEKAHEISRIMNLFTVAVLFGVIIIIFLSCDQRKAGHGVMSIDLSMRNNNGAFILILCVLLSLLTLCCLVVVSPRIHMIKSYRDNLIVYTNHNCFMNTFITGALRNFANGPPYQAQLFYELIMLIGCLSALPILLIALEKCIEPEKKEILIQNPDAED